MKKFVSIRTKLIINTMVTISLIFAVVLSVITFRDIRAVNRTMKNAAYRIRGAIIAKGNILVKNNSMAMTGMADDYSFTAVRELVSSTVRDDPDITYGIFMDTDHKAWAYTSPGNPFGIPRDEKSLSDETSQWAGSLQKPDYRIHGQKNEETIEFAAPVRVEDEILGFIRYGISTKSMHRALGEVFEEGIRTRNQTIVTLLMLSIASLFCSYLIVRKLAARITRPIAFLVDSARTIAEGDYSIAVKSDSNDELGLLVSDVDKMRLSIMQASDELREKNAELKRLDRLKDEFLANTSHELRTPLNGIIGIADSLIGGAAGPLTEKQLHNLSLIVSSGRRLAGLVNDILDFSKLRQKEIHLRTKPVDMRSLTDVVLMLSRALPGAQELEFVNQIGHDLPAADADEDRVQQILHNLVGNAVKFTDRGTISVSARVDEEHLAVTVSDTGIGIPKDRFESIFEAFEQADGSTERKYGGTGLGLAVTNDLVNLHGGRIWAASEPGKGSDFTFTLPVSKGKAQATQTPNMLRKPAGTAGTSETLSEGEHAQASDEQAVTDIPEEHLCNGMLCKILVVDDEPVNLQVLKNHLTSEHYAVTLASDGKEAIAAVESDQKFDLVLLDIMMPGMSGYEVCHRIRDMYPPNELPVVMLTAKNQVDDLLAGFGSGANDYLTKPFSKEELFARIDTHISLKNLHLNTVKAETRTKLLTQEMELARRIQTVLLPEKPEIPGYEIAASMNPADKVGGDYYDIISEAGCDWLVIGDVSGHGVPSGLVMMMVQTAIHTVLLENPRVAPARLLAGINRTIYTNIEKMGESKHMTILVLTADKEGNFSFSGLHEDILIRRADSGKVEGIETDGMWIGLEPEISQWLSTQTLTLNPGDCMILYTDGITEAMDTHGNLFGEERLTSIIEESGDRPASEIHKNIIDALESWEKPDDVTIVVVKRIRHHAK